MRRSVPLWRSDYAGGAVSQQSQTYGASLWLPFHGIGNMAFDSYEFRSAMTPSTLIFYDVMNKALDYDFIRKMSKQWWEVSSSYFGDYYPLTPYLIEGGWMAWQFNTPEKGEGFVQVFKRNVETSETMWSDTMSFKLQGLEPESKYMIKNMDVEATQTMTGAELMEKGIFIKADVSPSAYLFSYKKIQ
jgi:alpha-galactosidase